MGIVARLQSVVGLAAVLGINAADDERNPPETGLTEQALKRVKNGACTSSVGAMKRATTELLRTAPQRTM